MKPLVITDDELVQYIESHETDRTEFKERLQGDAPTTIREAICAFANDLPGRREPGIVVVGLQNDGTPAGTVIDERLILSLADMRSDGNIVPPPTLLVEKRAYKANDVAVVTVWPSDSPPVRYKGAIHIRIGPRRGIASPQEERILNERRRHGDRPFDVTPVEDTGFTDLNRRQFEDEYLPRAVDRQLLQKNDRTLEERFSAAKMTASVDDGRATILGLLVIGVRPRDFIPGAYVQFLRIAGESLSDEIIDELEIDGVVTDVLVRLEDKLRAHNRRHIDLVSDDRERRAESYPVAALQQLVRNAVMHRAYENTNAPVRVTWFDGRIEIQSPGGPFGSVTIENFGQPGVTDYRNPNLAEAMKVLGYVQRFGVGITTAQDLLRRAGHPDIEFTTTQSDVLAVVRDNSRQVGP